MLATCPHCCAEVKVPSGAENVECPCCHILFLADGGRSSAPAAPSGRLPPVKALLVAGGIVAALAGCSGIVALVVLGTKLPLPSPASATLGADGPTNITVKGVRVEYVGFMDGFGQRQADNTEKRLLVCLRVGNPSKTHKVDYLPWTVDGTGVSASDEHGNSYSTITYGQGAEVLWGDSKGEKGFWGLNSSRSIQPGNAIFDVIVLQCPVKAAKTITLTLPLRNVGGLGTKTLTIPASSIVND